MSNLWQFAVALYDAPGIQPLCLELQDRHGVDVPLLLALAWLHHQGLVTDKAGVERLATAARPWQEDVVGRLRQARRALRSPSPSGHALAIDEAASLAVKQEIQALELRAERLQLEALERLATRWFGTGQGESLTVILSEMAPTVPAARWNAIAAAAEQVANRSLSP